MILAVDNLNKKCVLSTLPRSKTTPPNRERYRHTSGGESTISSMICKKCGNNLTGKQQSYCSPKCSKLHLKSLYKKRNREKLNAYNRIYRQFNTPLRNDRLRAELLALPCQRCGIKDNINIHHIKKKILGGDDSVSNLMVLCFNCHMKWHNKLDEHIDGFWE